MEQADLLDKQRFNKDMKDTKGHKSVPESTYTSPDDRSNM